MSEFSVPVVRIEKIESHPNADTLSITEVEGCPVVFKTTDLKVGDLAVYIPVEAVVALNRPCFEFLRSPSHPERDTARIKAKRLRGVFSMGLLLPLASVAPQINAAGQYCPGVFCGVGDDLAGSLGIKKYEEIERCEGPAEPLEPTPWYKTAYAWIKHPVAMYQMAMLRYQRKKTRAMNFLPVYDMESLRKYKSVFEPGEQVYVSEKLHGTSLRCGYHKGKFFVGSHRTYRARSSNDLYWKAALAHNLEEKLKLFPHLAVYGEVYGSKVQDLAYGCAPGVVRLAVFDIYDTKRKRYLDHADFLRVCEALKLPRVPTLYIGPYDPAVIEPLANGKTTMPGANHIREGVVVKPVVERSSRVGRTILKLIGEAYMLRSGGTEGH